MAFSFLIDTNIFIDLEGNSVLDEAFSQFCNLAISNDCRVLVHKDALKKDLRRDGDLVRRGISLSKLKKYTALRAPLEPDTAYLDAYKINKVNDEIDAIQLFQVHRGIVDFFVSNDQGIARKAKSFNVADNVLSIDRATQFLTSTFSKYIPQHPVLSHVSVREIYNDLDDTFFDSLKADYKGFNNWVTKCMKEDRDCYTLRLNNKLAALLIYNTERQDSHQIDSISGEAIKICTLKVDGDYLGNKLGELFIQKMIHLAIEKGISAVYVTAYEKQHALINQFEKFGFRKEKFKNKQGRNEYKSIKNLKDAWEKTNSTKQHPLYSDNETVNKFIVPIQPFYYSTLFKDGTLRDPSLFDQTHDSLAEIQGNTIVKVYIGGFQRKDIKPGDLLFFYASKERKVVEPVGIVDSFKQIGNIDELWDFVNKRTVFSKAYLQSLLRKRKRVSVLKFRLSHYLSNPIPFKVLKELESCKNKLQSATRLRSGDYNLLKEKEYFDERFIID